MLKIVWSTSLAFCVAVSTVVAQITISIQEGEKKQYATGDQMKVQIVLKSRPETCTDGMRRAKVYIAGFSIQSQTDWKQIPGTSSWVKNMQLQVVPNSKKVSKLTVVRKVDKESLFKQMEFPVE